MKRSSRIWIGGITAVATFSLLVAFVGMKHRHHGMHYRQHCMEQCDHHKGEVKPGGDSKTPAATPPAEKSDTVH